MREWPDAFEENQSSMDGVLVKVLLSSINAQPFKLENWEKGQPII